MIHEPRQNSECRRGIPPFDGIKYCQCKAGYIQNHFKCRKWGGTGSLPMDRHPVTRGFEEEEQKALSSPTTEAPEYYYEEEEALSRPEDLRHRNKVV